MNNGLKIDLWELNKQLAMAFPDKLPQTILLHVDLLQTAQKHITFSEYEW
jgi:hypothetical protein